MKDIETILADLERQIGDTKSIDQIKDSITQSSDDLISINRRYRGEHRGVFKIPVVNETYKHNTYYTRHEYFVNYIASVNYENTDNVEYVQAHLQALNKYLKQNEVNNRNLVVIESILKQEIVENEHNKTTVAAKGYYDGLRYVLSAINYSRDKMMDSIDLRIKSEL